jgi:hypothetical protein
LRPGLQKFELYVCNVYRLAIVFAVNFDCPCPFFWKVGLLFLDSFVDYWCTVFKMGF